MTKGDRLSRDEGPVEHTGEIELLPVPDEGPGNLVQQQVAKERRLAWSGPRRAARRRGEENAHTSARPAALNPRITRRHGRPRELVGRVARHRRGDSAPRPRRHGVRPDEVATEDASNRSHAMRSALGESRSTFQVTTPTSRTSHVEAISRPGRFGSGPVGASSDAPHCSGGEPPPKGPRERRGPRRRHAPPST